MSQKKRSGCLTVFLIITLVLNLLSGLYLLIFGSSLQQAFLSMPGWTFPLLGILGLSCFVFATMIWKWKKWGIYGLGVSLFIAFFINLSIGLPLFTALLGLFGFIILVLLIRPVWQNFD